MAGKPSDPKQDVDLTPILAELRRIGDLLDARLPAASAALFKPGPAPIPLDEAGERAFEALRAWRLERARRDGLSPYIVAYDRSLRQVARQRPASLQDLQAIPGFGPAKAIKYGPELLEVLARH
jgi:ATP-dependent DNA helicase RecQ